MSSNMSSPHVLSEAKTLFALLTAVFLWASAFVGIRIGLVGYDPACLALFRYCIASICMVIFYLRLPQRHTPTIKELISIFMLGLIGFTIYNITLNYGEVTVNSGTASFILSQIPTGVAIVAVFFLHEKLGVRGWLGLCISIIGVGIIAFHHYTDFHAAHGIVLLLIATLSGSFYSVFHKHLLKKYHPIELIAYAIWCGTFCMLFYLPHLTHEVMTAPASATVAVIYLGIFPAAIGYLAWAYAVAHMPASKAGTYLYIMPIISTFLGWLMLNEQPTSLSLIGGFIALMGAVIVNKRKKVG